MPKNDETSPKRLLLLLAATPALGPSSDASNAAIPETPGVLDIRNLNSTAWLRSMSMFSPFRLRDCNQIHRWACSDVANRGRMKNWLTISPMRASGGGKLLAETEDQ